VCVYCTDLSSGCSIRFCSFEHAGENVWHVLEVASNSPAEMAGLAPFSDYIIGSPHMTLRNEDDFYSLVEEFLNKTLILYVYNKESDSCREVVLCYYTKKITSFLIV
jgi:hypothetical protein